MSRRETMVWCCPKCGYTIRAGDRFCMKCGVPFVQICESRPEDQEDSGRLQLLGTGIFVLAVTAAVLAAILIYMLRKKYGM